MTLASGESLRVTSGDDLRLKPISAEVLAREADGNPVYTRAAYGLGQVYVLTFPLETQLTQSPGAFHAAGAQPYYRIYQAFAAALLAERALQLDHPMLGLTEHPLSENERIAVIINYSPEAVSVLYVLGPGWQVEGAWYGTSPEGNRLDLSPNDALVLKLKF